MLTACPGIAVYLLRMQYSFLFLQYEYKMKDNFFFFSVKHNRLAMPVQSTLRLYSKKKNIHDQIGGQTVSSTQPRSSIISNERVGQMIRSVIQNLTEKCCLLCKLSEKHRQYLLLFFFPFFLRVGWVVSRQSVNGVPSSPSTPSRQSSVAQTDGTVWGGGWGVRLQQPALC